MISALNTSTTSGMIGWARWRRKGIGGRTPTISFYLTKKVNLVKNYKTF
jgi:hypothetical protein